MPEEFGRITFREFNLKVAAFHREEDRKRSRALSIAVTLGHYKTKADRQKDERVVNSLLRYPVPKWFERD